MSFTKLPTEIWTQIVQDLRPAVPLPLSGLVKEEAVMEPKEVIARLPSSGAPGTTSRSDIRATSLARLMRTSLAFNELAKKPLYERVITDDFVSLTSHLDGPAAHSNVPSKSALIESIRYLHVEYCAKRFELPYPEILEDDAAWSDVGMHSAAGPATKAAVAELDRLLEHLDDPSTYIVFEDLQHLTFGAFFGSQHEIWRKAVAMSDSEGRVADRVEYGRFRLKEVFANSLFKEFCQRVSDGPFSMQSIILVCEKSCAYDPPLMPDYNFHIETRNQMIPAAMYHRTRWILEEHDRAPAREAKRKLFGLLAVSKRERACDRRGMPPSDFEIEIYSHCEPPKTASAVIPPKPLVSMLGPTPDKITWLPLAAAPVCRACSGTFEPEETEDENEDWASEVEEIDGQGEEDGSEEWNAAD